MSFVTIYRKMVWRGEWFFFLGLRLNSDRDEICSSSKCALIAQRQCNCNLNVIEPTVLDPSLFVTVISCWGGYSTPSSSR